MNEEFWSDPETSSIIYEYRIVLPLSVDEYQIGQRYCTVEAQKDGRSSTTKDLYWSRNDLIKVNEKLAQYTVKSLDFDADKCMRLLSPKGFLHFSEESINNYPECRTRYSNDYMKEKFHVVIDSRHVDGLEGENNIFDLNEEELNRRKVEVIDIVNDKIEKSKCGDVKDPAEFRSEKHDRGPFQGVGWEKHQKPVMCIYKLYRIEFKWWGLQRIIEAMIIKAVREILSSFQRRVVCSMDSWMGMNLEDIKKYEDENMLEMNLEKNTLPIGETAKSNEKN